MILSKQINTPEATPTLKVGDRVHYITDGGRTFRLGTVASVGGFRVTIVLDSDPHKQMRVRSWNVRLA